MHKQRGWKRCRLREGARAPWHSNETPTWATQTALKKLRRHCRGWGRLGSPGSPGLAGEQPAPCRLQANVLGGPCLESSESSAVTAEQSRMERFLTAREAVSGRRRRSVSNLQPWRLPELALGALPKPMVPGGKRGGGSRSWGGLNVRGQPSHLLPGCGVPVQGGPPAKFAVTSTLVAASPFSLPDPGSDR
jgi:hypothetical protein